MRYIKQYIIMIIIIKDIKWRRKLRKETDASISFIVKWLYTLHIHMQILVVDALMWFTSLQIYLILHKITKLFFFAVLLMFRCWDLGPKAKFTNNAL